MFSMQTQPLHVFRAKIGYKNCFILRVMCYRIKLFALLEYSSQRMKADYLHLRADNLDINPTLFAPFQTHFNTRLSLNGIIDLKLTSR